MNNEEKRNNWKRLHLALHCYRPPSRPASYHTMHHTDNFQQKRVIAI